MRLKIERCVLVRTPDGKIAAIQADGVLLTRPEFETVLLAIESAIASGETEVEVKDE